MDDTVEEKVFAPGYGEFRTEAANELVTVALALPIDATGGRATGGAGSARRPRTGRLRRGRRRTLAGGRLQDQDRRHGLGLEAGRRHRPRALGRPDDKGTGRAGRCRRRPRPGPPGPPRPVGAQLLFDAAARDRAAFAGDMATLQVLWDHAAHTTDPAAARVSAALAALRRAGDGRRLAAAPPPSLPCGKRSGRSGHEDDLLGL